MQDLVALAQDLDLFRAQLADVLEGDEHSAVMLGRVADVEARLRAVDRDLREIAQSLNAPAVLRTPLKDILTGEATSFSKRTGIEARVDVAGDLEGLTSSARIALLRLVQEALANVAHHSHAAHARVELAVARGHIRVAVEDDGDGFDVETALVHAARAGRLGLVGMGERIRLLGGHFDVRSAPGGPTAVTAMIPKWRPVERAGDE
jgi:signal transduction histidine kinase